MAMLLCLGLLAPTARVLAQTSGQAAGGQPNKAPADTKPDSTYGEGGTRTVSSETRADGTRVTQVELRDKNGQLRERHTQLGSTDLSSVTHEWWDANGKKTQENGSTENHQTGEQIRTQATYQNDKQLTGDSWSGRKDGPWTHERFNPATGKYEPDDPGDPPKKENGPAPDDLGVRDNLTLGGSFIFEDAYHVFVTSGVDASYTHALPLASGPRAELGLMADVSWTRGSDDVGVTYSKLQALGGLALCERAWGHDMYFGAHVLAGVSHVRGEYQNTPLYTGTSFAIAAGFDAGKTINDRYDINVRVDYNPTIRNGILNNVRVGAGVRLRF